MSVSEISAFPPEESPRLARGCAITGKPFAIGERVYSVIYEEDGAIRRVDLCADAWRNFKRPATTIAWWSSRATDASDKDPNAVLAPNDALAKLFESLGERPDQADLRYALALLLTRRRVFRFEFDENAREHGADENAETIYVYSSRNDAGYSVPVVKMDAEQIERVQARLVALINSPSATLDAMDS